MDGSGCVQTASTASTGDLSTEEKRVVWATQFAPAADLFSRNALGVAWTTKPSWYIVGTEDRTAQPQLDRFVTKRMNATTYEVKASHVPMLSQPGFVLDVIRDAANAVQRNAVASGVAYSTLPAVVGRWAANPPPLMWPRVAAFGRRKDISRPRASSVRG